MGRKHKHHPPPGDAGLGLATTVKVDARPHVGWPLAPRSPRLKQRLTGFAQRFVPRRSPHPGAASPHHNRLPPHLARNAAMAQGKKVKLNFKKIRLFAAFAAVLGLAGVGGYTMMNAISRSFHKGSHIFDSSSWSQKKKPASSYRQLSGSSGQRLSTTGPKKSYHPRSYASGGRRHGASVAASRKGYGKQGALHRQHPSHSKKHAIKNRNYSKKLAKIKKASRRDYQKASVRYRRRSDESK